MNDQQIVDLAVSEIASDTFIRTMAANAPPQAVIMPFAHEVNKRFLAVALYLDESALDRHALLSICKRTYHILQSKQVFKGLNGVELSPFILKDRQERTFKLSVLSSAFDEIDGLTSENIGGVGLPQGMTCILYNKRL